MNKAIFLDRDGTINVEKHYLYKIEDFEFLPGVVDALKILQEKQQGVMIADVYFCPHLPDAQVAEYRKECNCRKPKLGMYKQAILDYNIQVGKSYAIGDKIRDCAICQEMPCRGFLIGNNEKPEVISEVKAGMYERVSYVASLKECVELIVNNQN